MNVRAGIAKELHKKSRINYPRRYVELKGMHDLYQADLVDLSSFSNLNKGYKFIITIIDCFTKFAFAFPLKSKRAIEIKNVLEPIFEKYPMKHFQTDQGTEFFNSSVSALLKRFGINHYHSFSEKKASIIERFNRTLKERMWRKFTEQGTFKWVNILPQIIREYNHTVHSTIGVKPIDVTRDNELQILREIIRRRKKIKLKQKFFVGDKVRISRIPRQFVKGYWPRWSNEVYVVWKVQITNPITYLLRDTSGQVLKGGFYQHELSKTKYSDTYLIEKVVRKQGNRLLVRWLGFDKTHDSWINKKDLVL